MIPPIPQVHEPVTEEVDTFDYGFGPDDVGGEEGTEPTQDQSKSALYDNMLLPTREET